MSFNTIKVNNTDTNYTHSIFDISEYTGKTYDTLSDALADVPDGKQKGGMSVSFVCTSDNKYVQYRCMSDSFTTNTDDWSFMGDDVLTECPEYMAVYLDADKRIIKAVKNDGTEYFAVGVETKTLKVEDGAEIYGDISTDGVGVTMIENPEFMEVYLDADKHILFGLQNDGNFYFGCGVPKQIVDYIEKKLADLSLDEYEDIVTFLNGLETGDKTLTELLDEKVDKEEGKSLIDEDVADGVSYVENPEYMDVETDDDNKILGGRKNDGTKFENVGYETPKISIDGFKVETFNDPEGRIEIKTDSEKKIVSYRDEFGVLHENAGIETPLLKTDRIDFSEQGLDKLEQDLINDGFNPGSGDDVVKSVSVAGVPIPKNLNDVPLPIASTEQYGLMSPQDKAWIGSLQPSINITGSGVTKNASAFGFLPTATAAANNTAIAAALDGGGTILVDVPGIYNISVPIVIPSNTTLIFGINTFVKMTADKQYAVVNEGAYERVYDENIKLIGLHLIANGCNPPSYDITEGSINDGVIYGLHGYVNFFYVKHLYISDYVLTDQSTMGYGANICSVEDVVVERVYIKGFKDGLHFGRGKRITVRDCVFSCYDDACTLNAVDFSRSQPEVGWIEDVYIENCYDMVNPNHQSAGFFSRFMGGAWNDWNQGCEVMLGSIVIVEDNGVKRMYRVGGGYSDGPDMRAWKFISTTKPTHTAVGSVVWLDEQQVTRTINGVTETATMKIPWVLQQTQDVGYDGGVKNATLKDIHLQKTRAFTIQYYIDNQWLNAIVPNARGISVQSNITFERVSQECDLIDSDSPRFVTINCPVKNISIKDCYIKHRVLLYCQKVNIEGLTYPEATMTVAGNTFTDRDLIKVALINGISNRIRLYGNILENSNCAVQNSGATFIQNDII